eukprot:SM003880S14418  [mRNA]  locus=s3880:25:1094:- [translate_table: standard]
MAKLAVAFVVALCLAHSAAAAGFYTGPVSADPKTWVVQDKTISDKHNSTCPPWSAFATPGKGCTNATCGTLFFKAKFELPQAQAHRISTLFGVTTIGACCNLCRTTAACSLYMWELQKNACTLLKPTVCTAGPDKVPFTTSNADSRVWYDNCEYPIFVGGLCNPNVVNDPHFTGAQGTRFDFNGLPDRTFCLVSDKQLHINMKLSGYLDSRTTGATALKNGKAIRTWIRELGILWSVNGVQHSAVLVARSGKQQERGAGYMQRIEADGQEAPRLA